MYKPKTSRVKDNSVQGHLRRLYSGINQRCRGNKIGFHKYRDKGIKNMFASADDLIDYVVNELQVDPRGLECHRINDSDHYRRGNIMFLSRKMHNELHGLKIVNNPGL